MPTPIYPDFGEAPSVLYTSDIKNIAAGAIEVRDRRHDPIRKRPVGLATTTELPNIRHTGAVAPV